MGEARVDFVDPATGEVVDHCHGPTLAGTCPRAGRDGVVPCAGLRVVPLGRGPEGWLVRVPDGARRCPLARDDLTAG